MKTMISLLFTICIFSASTEAAGIPVNQICNPDISKEGVSTLSSKLPHLVSNWLSHLQFNQKEQFSIYKTLPLFKIPSIKKPLQDILITCASKGARIIEITDLEDLEEIRTIYREKNYKSVALHFKRDGDLIVY